MADWKHPDDRWVNDDDLWTGLLGLLPTIAGVVLLALLFAGVFS